MYTFSVNIFSRSVLLFCLFFVVIFSSFSQDAEKENTIEIDSLNEMLPTFLLHNIDSGLIVAKKALRLAELNNYEKGRINALRGIAVFNQQLGKYGYAQEYIESALKYAEDLGNEKLLGSILFSKGFIETSNTHYDKAYEDYTRSSEIALRIGDTARYAFVLNNLGQLNDIMGDSEKALYYFKKSFEITLTLDNYQQTIITTTNVGSIYGTLKKNDSALVYYKKALSIVKPNDERHRVHILEGLSSTFLALSKLDSAEFYANRAIEVGEAYQNKKIISYAYGVLGSVYQEKGDMDKAIEYKEKGFQFLNNSKDYKALKISAHGLESVYKENKDFEKALYYSNLVMQFTDSINTKENTERLARLKAAKEYEAKLAEDKRRYTHRITTFISISLVLSIAVLFIIRGYIRQRKKVHLSELGKEELEKNLKKKDVDLLTKTMHLNEKEELIHGLEEKLKQLSRDMKPSKSRDIQSLISEIKVSKSENIWQEFESRFSSVNDDFLDRLKAKFPGLTPKELRLCSLLRLNLSTKEISALTHQNPLSINKARFRLRKKLEMNNTETNLTSFLMEF